jgi:thiamine pyrophosphokinase
VSRTVVVVAGGARSPSPALRAQLPPVPNLVVAADSGLAHADSLGLAVDLVVGDMDSVDPAALARAERAGAAVERHPAEKDQTDLELALDVALAKGGPGAHVVVVTSVAGRLDHGLANLLLLGAPAYAALRIDAYVDDWLVSVVRDRAELTARPGGLVTILPVGGVAHGVFTERLRYPLRRETLDVGTTRGVSNVAEAASVVVGVEAGVLLVLREWADSAS